MEDKRPETELIDEFLTTRSQILREEIILRYVSLVHYVVGRLGISQLGGIDYEDLASQGMLGLIDAVDHYDPLFGTRLSTYATLKIRSRLLDYLRELDWLPRTARQKVRLLQGAMTTLESQLLRLPTDEEIASYLSIDTSDLQQIQLDSSRVIISLDEENDSGMEDGSSSMHEWLTDEKQENPLNLFEEKDLRKSLVEAIKSLSEREQLVLSLYYFDELTFKEIGKTLEISESRVCQIHGRAVIGLKSLLAETSISVDTHPRQTRNDKRKERETPVSTPQASPKIDRYQ
ncbi:MAG: FliA/WhiG family RNA polymerase sigma factor [Anaerolineaceae bacterium]